MTRNFSFAVALGLSLAVPFQGHAQAFLETCEEDIALYCADVEPGDGRTMACLYAHSATLGDACFEATDPIARAMEAFFDRLAETMRPVPPISSSSAAAIWGLGSASSACARTRTSPPDASVPSSRSGLFSPSEAHLEGRALRPSSHVSQAATL